MSSAPAPQPADPKSEVVVDGRAGDAAGFEACYDGLVRAHYVRLTSFAYRMLKSWDAAEDAVQQVLFKVWKRKAPLNFDEPLPYLYQAVRNECLMALRQQGRRDAAVLRMPEGGTASADPVDDAELQAAVARAVEALPERCRLIFTMSREQELTYGEIARILGLSVKTVETQMGRAFKALRRTLGPYLGGAVALLASAGSWHTLSR
jgi:RNA polymerase sigma-70 factor (ECF subfamily)